MYIWESNLSVLRKRDSLSSDAQPLSHNRSITCRRRGYFSTGNGHNTLSQFGVGEFGVVVREGGGHAVPVGLEDANGRGDSGGGGYSTVVDVEVVELESVPGRHCE